MCVYVWGRKWHKTQQKLGQTRTSCPGMNCVHVHSEGWRVCSCCLVSPGIHIHITQKPGKKPPASIFIPHFTGVENCYQTRNPANIQNAGNPASIQNTLCRCKHPRYKSFYKTFLCVFRCVLSEVTYVSNEIWGQDKLGTTVPFLASFPGSPAPECKHWSCAGGESLVCSAPKAERP